MKRITRYLPAALILLTMGTACKKYIDVNNPDTLSDPTFWKTENSVRTYNWEFYNEFPGYGNGSGTNGDFYYPTLSDDQTPSGFTTFPATAPANSTDWTFNTTVLSSSNVPTYTLLSFGYIRKANIMLDRVDLATMDAAAKAHWKGIAHFFRAYTYFKLVQEYGGVPFYGHGIEISDSINVYKPRDTHQLVMDSVPADLNFAVANLRAVDQPNTVNRDVALALKARVCLWEGTYRKYHTELNMPNADQYLQAAKDAANTLITAGTYTLAPSYQTAYNSEDLGADKSEMLLYKRYDAGVLMHSLIAYLYSTSIINGPSKSAVESYLCTDGKPITLSALYQGDATLSNVKSNRDLRMGITIDTNHYAYAGAAYNSLSSSTGYRPIKFLPDTNKIKSYPTQINTNTSDAPLFWLAEVYLNYAEAAAELQDMGKYTLTQADLDATINKLRARGKVAPLTIAYLRDPTNADPKKDADVSSTIWEIRRERRVELMMDGFRYQDLMRWKKGSYFSSTANPDSWLGAKVPGNPKVLLNSAGYITPYAAATVRNFVDPKNYLSPIPTNQILLYPGSIQTTMQNPGW
ncbi:RagB/SusD family nutrient uptake outer membrane protein [Puia sp. P3]|uniref:RagB/SusD family nutrient uptake outer membrane protein n=1 Tax=Puia sp. P3 TaxID=3423952 RepID=UPI003D66AF7F